MPRPLLSLSESQAMAAVRAFLLAVLPHGTEVIAGQDNRVPPPVGVDFVVMTPVLRERLSTNVTTWRDGWPDAPCEKAVRQATKLAVQLDLHGPAGADATQLVTTLWRDVTACDALASSALDLAPLYASEARQIPFLNGEQQVETRWSVDLVLQVNPAVTVPQAFAASLEIGDAGHPVTAQTTTVQPWAGLIEIDTRGRHKPA
ncbi:phage neck terminator protein [Paraburkholderia adhaesiva]